MATTTSTCWMTRASPWRASATAGAVRNGGEEVELRREEDGTLVLSILKDPAGAVFALFQSEEMDDEEDDD